MEGNGSRPAQEAPLSMPDASSGDWRSQISPESRQQMVNKITETLKRYLPISVPEGINELQKIAFQFEDKIYSTAANQVHSKRRNRLVQKRMNDSVFVMYNLRLKDREREREKRKRQNVEEDSFEHLHSDDEWITEKEDPVLPKNNKWLRILDENPNQDTSDEEEIDEMKFIASHMMRTTTLHSIAPTGHVAVADLQEEIYQKIRSMKDLYFADLNEFRQRISLKLQQNDSLPSAKAVEQFEKLKGFKLTLDRTMYILQLSKANIKPSMKDKIPEFEKQLQNVLATNKQKLIPSQPPGQQQFQHPSSHSQLVQLQQQTQVSQLQQHDNYANQQNNIQGSSNSMQTPSVQNMQHGSLPLSPHFDVTPEFLDSLTEWLYS